MDIGGDYAFAKYNKKVEVPEFTEREYEMDREFRFEGNESGETFRE